MLGKTLADLLVGSTAGAESADLGDSFTISMIGNKLGGDFTSLTVDASEAPPLI